MLTRAVCRAAFHAAKNPIIKAIVGYHPSLQIGPKLFGETEESVADGVVAPVLFMPAGGDPANVKPGGAIVTLLQAKFGDKTSSVECARQRVETIAYAHM